MKLYDEENKIDFTQEPMFLGIGRNMQRYDVYKYKIFFDMAERMDSVFWKPNEISLVKDKIDYHELTEHERRIFDLNLKRQILLDSIQGRSITQTFSRVTTLPELEYVFIRWEFQESNHSNAYSHILRNVYDNPADVFDTIIDDEMIKKHAKTITEHYERLYELINSYEADQYTISDHMIRQAIYLAFISVNILEGVRFYVSFACTFAFAENKKMEGNAKELKLIARDENMHLALTQKIINILRKEDSEGFTKIIEENSTEVEAMYQKAADEEIEWAEYLFRDGSILGLNTEILTRYMKYITNQRMRAIGLNKLFTDDGLSSNPLPWMDSWLGSSKTEELPQETELSSYLVGALDKTIEEDAWGDL